MKNLKNINNNLNKRLNDRLFGKGKLITNREFWLMSMTHRVYVEIGLDIIIHLQKTYYDNIINSIDDQLNNQ